MTVAVPGTPRAAGRADGPALAVAGLAAGVVLAGLALGWRGVDLPAQLYRVGLFRQEGFALWDTQWFGGHWLLDYSVLFPAVAAAIGVGAVTVVSAVAATVAFDRLIVGGLGPPARPASVVFALGVAVQSAIGQLPFLLGEAAGLFCAVALARRRWWLAAPLAAGATLASPLAGAFVALAATALWLAELPAGGRSRSGLWRAVGRSMAGPGLVVLAAAGPVAVTAVLFPGQGPMPYPVTDYLWELAVAGGLWVIVPPALRALRAGVLLYALAATASELVATPLGGNIGRLEDLVAVPLAVGLLWPRAGALALGDRRRVRGWADGQRRLLLAAVAVPLVLSQWGPAWAAMTSNPARPWTHAAYYRPLVTWLEHQGGPAGRTEVVPTADHWEADYVAPAVPLARGWERQLDLADDPIFYRPGALDTASYRAWLLDNGVRWVALADAPLDSAGVAEGALVRHGVPGLRPAWHGGGWSVYQVVGSQGIVGPGARLLHLDGSRVTLALGRPGPVVVRVRWSKAWHVAAGPATVTEAPGRWLLVEARGPGVVDLRLRLL